MYRYLPKGVHIIGIGNNITCSNWSWVMGPRPKYSLKYTLIYLFPGTLYKLLPLLLLLEIGLPCWWANCGYTTSLPTKTLTLFYSGNWPWCLPWRIVPWFFAFLAAELIEITDFAFLDQFVYSKRFFWYPYCYGLWHFMSSGICHKMW